MIEVTAKLTCDQCHAVLVLTSLKYMTFKACDQFVRAELSKAGWRKHKFNQYCAICADSRFKKK